jgi:hypothetical protein
MTAAIALLAFGALTAGLSLQLPLGTLRAPGSGFFPFALGLMLVALAAGELLRLRLAKPKPAPAAPAPAAPAPAADGAARRVVLFMAVVAVTTAMLQPIGYVGSSFLLMLGLLRVLGLRWGASALIAALSAAAGHVLFVLWLRIPMPAGPFGF